MYNYPLIIFEGIESTGKTTQIKNVTRYLKKKKIKFISLREPGGSKYSESIRKLILDNKSKFHPLTDLLLYIASRNENIKSIILKNYKKKVILIDRFIYSTIAYQHFGMGINRNDINKLNSMVLGKIKPDYIFLHTVNMSNLKKRILRRRKKNRYDKFSIVFYKKVQNGFLKMLKHKKNVTVVNTDENIHYNKTTIIKKINNLLRYGIN